MNAKPEIHFLALTDSLPLNKVNKIVIRINNRLQMALEDLGNIELLVAMLMMAISVVGFQP